MTGASKVRQGRWVLGLVVGSLAVVALWMVGSLRGRPTGLQAAAPGGVAPPLVVALPRVVINEVAWGGTAYDPADEWIELYNNTGTSVDLAGWRLKAEDGQPDIALAGVIPAHSYFLLERSHDDCTVGDIPADQTYTYGLGNEGELLELLDGSSTPIDSVDGRSGWPAGSASPGYCTMERIDATASGEAANWASNNGRVHNGQDCGGEPLSGTPRARNSVSYADLGVDKQGPKSVLPGGAITYTIVVSNAGQLPAQATWLTDVLPPGVEFQSQGTAYPFSRPEPGTLVWDLGTVPTTTVATPIRLTVVGQVDEETFGELTNAVTVTSATTESWPTDNQDALVTMAGELVTPVVVIESLYAQTYGGLYDEAFRLMNVSTATAHLDGWTFGDGAGEVVFPAGTGLAPGQRIWCSRKAEAFRQTFGFFPDYEWAGDDPAVPDLDYSGSLRFNDEGDVVTLWDAGRVSVDVLVYGEGQPPASGWNGPAVQPYHPSNVFPTEGQILYRKRDQRTGWPVPDTDRSADWAQDSGDAIDGRRVQYPGWDLDDFFWTARVTETAVLTVVVGPDHLLETVLAQIEGAEESIWIEGYTIESGVLAQALVKRLKAGVDVTLLLEGGPAGGVAEAQRWICDQIQKAGGQVYYLSSERAPARYRTQHGKFMLIDDRLVLIGSENLNPSSMPADDKGDGTAGRRGVYVITDAPGVVDRVRAIMAADLDPANHEDVASCSQLPDLCTGSPPFPETEWVSYTVAFSSPLTVRDVLAFEVVQSPDNSLRDRDALLGLLNRAGTGDTVLVEQFYESHHWGGSDGTPESDPNPRLEAYLDAARRGARVRILLDGYFGGEDNAATVAYLQDVAGREGLGLQARLANPTFLGLHNKMVLARIDGLGYIHVGSMNGREASSKVNRELALQVQSDQAYEYLKAVFDYDWRATKLFIYLPLAVGNYQAPQLAGHLLVSEVYYPADPEKQWLEVINASSQMVDLSAYKVGDAGKAGDYEGMYSFPVGAKIEPYQVLVVAVNANRFWEKFPGRPANFEIVDSDPGVPNLDPYRSWGKGDWWLRQDGDEVVLLGEGDRVVDAVAYGDSAYPLVVVHPGVGTGHSLERYPAGLDSDDCAADFREQTYPNPGEIP